MVEEERVVEEEEEEERMVMAVDIRDLVVLVDSRAGGTAMDSRAVAPLALF